MPRAPLGEPLAPLPPRTGALPVGAPPTRPAPRAGTGTRAAFRAQYGSPMDDADKPLVDEESQRMVADLVARFPWFEPLYESHVDPDVGSLPHVFFWDVTRAVVASFVSDGSHGLDWAGVLGFLEEQTERGVPEVDVVLGTSFLSSLPWPGQPGYGVVARLGPAMAADFRRIRPEG